MICVIVLNTWYSTSINNGNELPKVLCGPPALFSEDNIASHHHFCQKHTGPDKILCNHYIKPRVFYFPPWGRGWKAKFQVFLYLSKRPVSLVSKNQNHEFLPTSKKRHSRISGRSVTFIICAERALNNINGCILNCYYKSEFYHKIKFLKKAE